MIRSEFSLGTFYSSEGKAKMVYYLHRPIGLLPKDVSFEDLLDMLIMKKMKQIETVTKKKDGTEESILVDVFKRTTLDVLLNHDAGIHFDDRGNRTTKKKTDEFHQNLKSYVDEIRLSLGMKLKEVDYSCFSPYTNAC